MHQKHTKLAKPHAGTFARQEWAVLGTTCGQIQAFTRALAQASGGQFKVAYVDADHKTEAESEISPFALELTDKIGFHRLETRLAPTIWHHRAFLNEADFVFVNGNHFSASRQWVALDPKKTDSLRRKTARLTQVEAFLLPEGVSAEIPDFLKECVPNWAALPVFSLAKPEGMLDFLKKQLAPPSVQGLVLAGGRSTRMGRDKGLLNWHGRAQRDYMADLLENLGLPTFIACRPEQVPEIGENRALPDTFVDLGPFGAILSAFRAKPDAAWLVVACDLPLLDAATLQFLLQNRAPSALATAFKSPLKTTDGERFPEPLLTLWEPKAYPVLLQFLAQGISCPRKVLINSTIHLLEAPDSAVLTNVNTPEEMATLRVV